MDVGFLFLWWYFPGLRFMLKRLTSGFTISTFSKKNKKNFYNLTLSMLKRLTSSFTISTFSKINRKNIYNLTLEKYLYLYCILKSQSREKNNVDDLLF